MVTLPGLNDWETMYQSTLANEEEVRATLLSHKAEIVLPDEVWANNLYTASVYYLGEEGRRGPLEISYHRHDREAIHDWRHGQWIKNDIAGPEREGLELYPRESRLMDAANEYHIFVLYEGVDIPFGSQKRAVREPGWAVVPTGKARQREGATWRKPKGRT